MLWCKCANHRVGYHRIVAIAAVVVAVTAAAAADAKKEGKPPKNEPFVFIRSVWHS